MRVLKAVLCNITGVPVALVLVDKATRTIRVAGAYPANGGVVHVVEMKVSADKRKISKFEKNFPSVVDSVYNARTNTFSLL